MVLAINKNIASALLLELAYFHFISTASISGLLAYIDNLRGLDWVRFLTVDMWDFLDNDFTALQMNKGS